MTIPIVKTAMESDVASVIDALKLALQLILICNPINDSKNVT